jgi:hypothetical protein
MANETIANQQATSQESNAQATLEQQTPELSTQGQSAAVESVDAIPQKFVGKSPMEIIQAYKELEKERGRLASELGSTRKDKEELETRYKQVESAYTTHQNQVPAPRQVQIQAEEEVDPVSVFEAKFEEDPRVAIRDALKELNNSVSSKLKKQTLAQLQAEASDFYNRQKRENPDYARREPIMQQLALEMQDIIRPEALTSVKALKALDLMSRGADIEYYTKQAAERAQKDGLSVRSEKQRAQSESASSQGDKQVSFAELSLDDMRKALGRSDD